MGFKLPRYSDLTDEQRVIVNLPLDKNHLVTGAPGTGKSVIAIYRASDMSNAGKDVLMLVYNRPLMMYIKSAVESLDIDAQVSTWQSWISKFYKEEVGTTCPQTDGAFTYDWPVIKKAFGRLGKKFDQVIVDEAQDVPLELIESLMLISKGVTCFMDEKQSIMDRYTDAMDVAEVLGVKTAYALWNNFRNPKGIYDFAKVFNPEADSDTVNQDTTKPSMIKCSDYGHANATQLTSKMVQVIKRNYGLNYIGVFVNNKSLNATYEELRNELDDTDVFMFKAKSKDHNTIDFDEPGVYILSYNTMKGLEFDAVLLPRPECINSSGDSKVDNNILYVATTRASQKLYGFYFKEHASAKFIDFFSRIDGHRDLLSWE
ncbi:DNA/RNA helicase domain-containing protein [Butyrivibrio sp. AE3009]|uniref:DNA/RNA helicase domain-containing protein n=1 Tax=Butyrivibrio sp. AE3009 TaxID=1280666 RepID=UPI0003B6AAC2|nr:DNA/RNA helicase domain-containing protein [Butyrivibrio sp. AE3009]